MHTVDMQGIDMSCQLLTPIFGARELSTDPACRSHSAHQRLIIEVFLHCSCSPASQILANCGARPWGQLRISAAATKM